jgi:hypothetical protein
MKTMAQNRHLRVFFFSPMKKKRQLDHGRLLLVTHVGAAFKGRATSFCVSSLLRKVENSINVLLVCLFMCCSLLMLAYLRNLSLSYSILEELVLYSFDYFFTSIWLFTKVFVWIRRISIGRERKLKKVCSMVWKFKNKMLFH